MFQHPQNTYLKEGKVAFSTESAHRADSVSKLRCPCVCVCVPSVWVQTFGICHTHLRSLVRKFPLEKDCICKDYQQTIFFQQCFAIFKEQPVCRHY